MTRLLVSEARRHDHTTAPPLPASRAGWLVGARWQQPPTVPGGGDTHAPDGDDRVDRAKPPRAFRVHPRAPFPPRSSRFRGFARRLGLGSQLLSSLARSSFSATRRSPPARACARGRQLGRHQSTVHQRPHDPHSRAAIRRRHGTHHLIRVFFYPSSRRQR